MAAAKKEEVVVQRPQPLSLPADLIGLASLLDSRWQIPGTPLRVGVESLLGLLPGIGDSLGGVLSAYIIYRAARLGAPAPTLLRMAVNAVLDTVVGIIPIAGDAFDFFHHANLKNIRLLEKHRKRAPAHKEPRTVQETARLFLGVAAALVLVAAGAVAAFVSALAALLF